MIIGIALKINFMYDKVHDCHNHDLVGYVVQKYPLKIVKASVLTRLSAESWYVDIAKQYDTKRYIVLIGTVSLIGEVDGIQDIEREASSTSRASEKDPSAN